MQSQNPFFDDLVRLMNGAAGTVAGMGREAEATARARIRDWMGGLDLVSRDEFEAVKAMAVAARDEADALRRRLDALEAPASAPASGPASPAPGGLHAEVAPVGAPPVTPGDAPGAID